MAAPVRVPVVVSSLLVLPALLLRGRWAGYKPKAISGEHAEWLLQRVRSDDFALRGLVAELAGHGLKVDDHSVWDVVHAEKLSFKKAWRLANAMVARSRGGEPNGPKYQACVEAERLVFIGETWTGTDMPPSWGWAPRGHFRPRFPTAAGRP
ncbi:hypothetical protein E4K65_46410 [Bradyrhizobium niftali]|uniref:Uncharacterized protein n=1 Tax=Bradyrhizobium niftali TaxID=2560055 RepID=A0A4Y9L0B0_9BRAD|nr:hypothetical protein [Bradyrhizobium niftali]TFV35644.1 hypothetical protein E4K65_46410 [Bradyrhizobium niftali]